VTPSLEILNPLPGVYAFKVRAVNLAGASSFSNVSATSGVPSTPGDIVVIVVNS
jgi:hypothetical protein